MSNLDRTPGLTVCGGRTAVAARPVQQVIAGREVWLGESTRVRRLLPTLGRRMVGAWCFIDHYGPDDIAAEPGMQVPPHPHIGLQTVSWLLDGEVLHRDSLGNEQLIGPGELGLMTAGRAIAHAEQSPAPHPALLHGAQLWVALPDAARGVAPAWQHHADLPAFADAGLTATVILGELGGEVSPGRTHSPLVGADLALAAGARAQLPLEADFEYAVLAASGFAEVDGTVLEPGALFYLGCGRGDVRLVSEPGARLLLLGGEPFAEQIVMWWNFVARTGEEIAAARTDWMHSDRFGTVHDYDGEPLAAPPLPATPLKPRRADG
ncbi:MAG TPA: pirin family protein [Jatrophihabitantaceae bacterium]|nr:pirin family protein [Jatrophihabitantaceae bacterium]